MPEILVGNVCGKILQEDLMGKLWEILAGKSYRKILWENLVGNSCREILWENLAEESCGKILRENHMGQGGGEKANLRKAEIGGNSAFGLG